MSYPATARATELLRFIEVYMATHEGVAPSFDEMREHLDVQSKSGVHRLLRQLERRGLIRRKPSSARCIEVLSQRAVTVSPALYRDLSVYADRHDCTVEDAATGILSRAMQAWSAA